MSKTFLIFTLSYNKTKNTTMATRATITVRLNEKIRLSVYSHWDGYPEHVGKLLKEVYNTKAKALELVSYGNISSLQENLKPSENDNHNFQNPTSGVTIFYGRDRGETDVECEILKNSESIDEQEYNYYFDNDVWTVNGIEY